MPETIQTQSTEQNESTNFFSPIKRIIQYIREKLVTTQTSSWEPVSTSSESVKETEDASEINNANFHKDCITQNIIDPINEWVKGRTGSKLTPEEKAKIIEVVEFWQDVAKTDFIPTMKECIETIRTLHILTYKDDNEFPKWFNSNGVPFGSYFWPFKIHEVITIELVEGLSDYILEAANRSKKSNGEPFLVVEVGAGSGKLTHSLQKYCDKKSPGTIKFIATDNGKAGYDEIFEVERLGHLEAVMQYKPDIILNSWMPVGVDFSKNWRHLPYVKEYILIGEWDGCTGSRETYKGWNGDWDEELECYESKGRDGFTRTNLDIPTLSLSIGNCSSVDAFKRA